MAAQAKRRDPEIANVLRRSWDFVLGDHLVMLSYIGLCRESAGLLLKDKDTSLRDLMATADNSAAESQRVMKHFAGRHKVVELFF